MPPWGPSDTGVDLMAYDVVIKGGTVIDGTGAPGFAADVAVQDGRIAEVGPGLDGRQVLDAGGQVVAPGFIDIHTHYDAQVFWDPGLTPSSYPLFKKIFHDVGPVPSFLKILDSTAVARKKWGAAGLVAGPLLGLGLSVFARSPGGNAEVEVRPVVSFSDEYDDLWLRARGSFASCVRRDARYLRWKYLACPFRSYRVLEARKAGVLSGFAVLRDEGDANFKRGVIADLFCDTRDTATQDALLAAAIDDFKRARRVRIEVYCYNRRIGANLRRHGFRSGTTGVQYCVAYRGTPDAGNGPKPVLSDLANWNLFIGDGDLDRA